MCLTLTTQIVSRFADGQLEIDDHSKQSSYRGEIMLAELHPPGIIKVWFKWLAKWKGGKYFSEPVLYYEMFLYEMEVYEIGEGYYMFRFDEVWVTFYPPDGSKLDPNEVEGLTIPA